MLEWCQDAYTLKLQLAHKLNEDAKDIMKKKKKKQRDKNKHKHTKNDAGGGGEGGGVEKGDEEQQEAQIKMDVLREYFEVTFRACVRLGIE